MGKILNFNSQFGVGVRIGAGYFVITLLLLVSSGLSWRGIDWIDNQFRTYSSISDSVSIGSEIEADINSLRRHVIGFAASGDGEARAEIDRLDSDIRKQIAEAIDLIKVEERRGIMRQVSTSFMEYMANIQRLKSHRDALTASVDQGLNVVGLQAQKTLAELFDAASDAKIFAFAASVGSAQEDLALLRINMMTYLNKPDRGLDAEFNERFAELTKSLDLAMQSAPEDTRRSLRLLQEAAARYSALSRTARDAAFAIDEIVFGLNRKIAGRIDDLLQQLEEKQGDALSLTKAAVQSTTESSMRSIVVIGAVSLGLAVLIAFFVTRGITRPIAGMTSAMGALANGDLTMDVPARANRDELGEMAKAVQVFKDNAIRVTALEEEQRSAAVRAAADKRQAMETLAAEFEAQVGTVVNGLSNSAGQLQISASSMLSTAEQTSERATAVAAASEQASANVQTVATAAEELSSSIAEISRQVGNSSQIASQAVSDVDQTGRSVETLAEAAQKIGDVVKLISDIASQTNLLALNATIEAARAGDAGKGFAVVASEVKNLASQTARATNEIGGQIAEIQTATDDAVMAMRAIGETIRKMNEIAATIASAVEQQGAATQEIARNVQQAAEGTSEVSQNIIGVNVAANETGVAAGQMKEASSTMGAQADELDGAVGRFLAQVRAG